MDTHEIQLVQQSFEKVAAMGLPAAELFYAELFAIDPSLKSMFSGNMQEQHKKLLAALALVIRSLNNPEKITRRSSNSRSSTWSTAWNPSTIRLSATPSCEP
jgi:hemoglobin-like flavoprotein